MNSEDGIVLLRDELFRVPNNVIWGYVTYQTPGDEAAADNFLSNLHALSKVKTYTPGYYGHFTISPLDGKIFVYDQPLTTYIKTFLLEYTDTDTKLTNLLNEYRQNQGNNLTIKLFNSKGKMF